MKKNYAAFILAALVIPATGLLAQGRGGGRAGGGGAGRPGGGTVSRQPGGQSGARPGGTVSRQPGGQSGARPGGTVSHQPGARPGGPVPGERRLGGAVVISGGRPSVRPINPPPPPPPPTRGPVVVSPDFFDPLLPGYGYYGYRRGHVIVVPRSTVIVTEPEVVQEVVTERLSVVR